MPKAEDKPIQLFTWTCKDQWDVFHSGGDFVVVTTGRRWGKTQGMANLCIENALNTAGSTSLWVDVTQAKILTYVERYFLPVLNRLPKIHGKPSYDWSRQRKILTLFNNSVIEFGSAEVPENLEGLGYGFGYINELGIILQNASLWRNTLVPMFMENTRDADGKFTQAKIIAVGTMKRGCSLGIEWVHRAVDYQANNPTGKEYLYFKRSMYDNPLLSVDVIMKTELEVTTSEVPAEIHGEIPPELGTDYVIPYSIIVDAIEADDVVPEKFVRVRWGLDCAGPGDDFSALAKRRGNCLLEPVELWSEADVIATALRVEHIYITTEDIDKPDKIMIDANGLGRGVYDFLRGRGLPVFPVMTQSKAGDALHFTRYRSELWWLGRKWFESRTVRIPNDKILVKQLTNVYYEDRDGKVHVENKKALRKRGVESPDAADAFLLTLAGGADAHISSQRRRWMTPTVSGNNNNWLRR